MDKHDILREARATLERTSPQNLEKNRIRYSERMDGGILYTEPAEDKLTKWRREMTELAEERGAAEAQLAVERERLSMVRSLAESAKQTQRDIAGGLNAVNEFATVIKDRLDDMASEIAELRIKLKISDARFEDLKKSFDARSPAQPSASNAPNAEIVDLPSLPLAKARRA
jgi:hypothetical protein